MAFLLAETVFNDARQKLINGTARFFLKERLELQIFFHRSTVNGCTPYRIVTSTNRFSKRQKPVGMAKASHNWTRRS